MKRSTKPMAPGGLPAPTKAQVDLFKKLVDQVGCAVCLFYCRHPDGSRVEGSVGQIHHLLAGTNRISHWHVIPLCKMHHDEGRPGNPSRHSILGQYGKAEFERTFATEMELVVQCEEWINQPYVTGLLTDEQAPQGDSDHTDTTTDDKRTDRSGKKGLATLSRMEVFGRPVRIHVMHHRFRLADFDGLNAKGAIDGIVQAGLLQDDSPKFVQGPILHDQVKVASYAEEKTVVTLEEV